MPLTAHDWNVVVLGYWNRGILTPGGIATRLLEMPPGANFQVEVPIDALAPFRITHQGLTVMVTNSQLIVEASQADYPTLERALAVARRAVTELPETPITTAGFNVRYEGTAGDGDLAPLNRALEHSLDLRVAEAGYAPQSRGLVRALRWNGGKIQLSVTVDLPSSFKVYVNFERAGAHDELVDWLNQPVTGVRDQVRILLLNVLELPEGAVP